MQEQEIVLTEYRFTGISDTVYHPIFKDGKWFLVGVFPRALSNVACLCGIPDEDVVMLKLTYGG